MNRKVPMTPARRQLINERFGAAADAISVLANDQTIPEDERLGCLLRIKNGLEFQISLLKPDDPHDLTR